MPPLALHFLLSLSNLEIPAYLSLQYIQRKNT